MSKVTKKQPSINSDIQDVGLISQDKLKQVISELGRCISGEDTHQLLTIISDVGKISQGVKLFVDIRNWHITRKINAFVETLDSQQINTTKYQELCQKYGQDKLLREVLVRLDRFGDEVHAKILAYLMTALITNELAWQEFISLSFCLELLNPQDIESYTDSNSLGMSFITAGLAYITYNVNGGPQSVTPNGKRFNNFYDFGMKPYLEDRKKEQNE